ncbi:Gfo/Idh/MocA family protein [Xanthobacter autotrophicus]|uniref:Gfo/Idh/MocA family protein n=1 Tax=Xanthobacter autotrophicus TaxID=280 RepID=UPI00372871BA
MKIGIIGCGYVFDHYMSTWDWHPDLIIKGVSDSDPTRLSAVTKAYGLNSFASNEALLADPEIGIVVNLTGINSHYEVTKAALKTGKHVYSEKPLTTSLDEARRLFSLAEERGLRLSCAPSNALSDTTQTTWKAVREGAVGDVRVVYAEFEDNVIYLMQPETWKSRTGAPWPYLHEYEQGCTVEHVGYHLTSLCAIFGPVESVTAFSKLAFPDKTDLHLDPADTPDFSVACLNFRSGVVARVTCSIGTPQDHRMRIVGNKGMLTANTYRDYRCPVYLETFNQLTLNARKAISVRRNSLLQWIFGIGGRKLPPVGNPPKPPARNWTPRELIAAFKRRELGQQDKTLGIAELARAIKAGRPSFPPHDFTLHLTELTIAIQNAGMRSKTYEMSTTFAPIEPREETLNAPFSYAHGRRSCALGKAIDRMITRMHGH